VSATTIPDLTEDERLAMVQRVAWSVEPLLQVILDRAHAEAGSDMSCLLLGLVPRLAQLNYAIMEVAGGDAAMRETFYETGLQMPEVQHG
jgi:hypothetical protein